MKVPTLQSNRVAEQQGALGYAQVPSNLGDGYRALAGGLRQLGGAISQYEASANALAKDREEKTKRFDALTALNDFELEGDVTQTEMKRQSDPSGKNFAKDASALWDKRAEDFISKRIPPDLQEEFKYRLSENRQRVLRDAYDFEYKSGDAWFRKGIEEQLNKARTAIAADPDKLAEWQTKMDEVINAADLSQIEKDDLRDKVHVGLVATEYFQQVKRQALKTNEAGVTDFSNEFEATKALIRKEEAFAPNSYYDTNAERIGFGSDTITRGGKQYTVRKGDKVTREEAEADLEYRLQQREGAAVRRQLKDEWQSLPNNVKAALYSVGYNYGSLPSTVVKAVKTGDVETIAQSIESLSANKSRRKREANIVRGSASIDLDEKYANIPFDDRVQIRNAAEREARQEYNENQKLLTAQLETQRNDLFVGLFDGTKNETDIQRARDDGLLTDIDHITKAQNILDKRNEQVNLTSGFNDILTRGIFDPTDDDQKKMYNAWIGPDGVNKLISGDKEYFNQVIKPTYERVGALATDVAGAFQGMMRSGDQRTRMFALDALSQLQDSNPTAFAAQVPDALQKQVDYWDARKGLVTDPQELLRNLDGGTTQEERQRRLSLRKDAEGILAKREAGVPAIDEIMTEVVGEFDNAWFSDPLTSGVPQRRLAMQQEFQTLFVDAYEMYGTVDESKAAAIKTMKQSWGVSPVGRGVVMKYGVDKAGYPRDANGTYDWIDKEVRVDFKLDADTEYELVSDEKTRQEFEAFRQGKSSQPPSYRVMTQDKNGVWRDASDDLSSPDRVFFKKTEEMIKKDVEELDKRNEVYNLTTRQAEIIQMRNALDRAKPGAQLPQEVLDEEKDIQERLDLLNKQPEPFETPEELPSMDIMGNPF
ncbi:MAG TPA: hypothetical protein VIM69_10670 [Opitutaceae bacterium]